jgi:hypothetical protein
VKGKLQTMPLFVIHGLSFGHEGIVGNSNDSVNVSIPFFMLMAKKNKYFRNH